MMKELEKAFETIKKINKVTKRINIIDSQNGYQVQMFNIEDFIELSEKHNDSRYTLVRSADRYPERDLDNIYYDEFYFYNKKGDIKFLILTDAKETEEILKALF